MSGKDMKSTKKNQRLAGLTSKTAPKAKKLLEQVSEALRTKHYAYRTEETYVDWIG